MAQGGTKQGKRPVFAARVLVGRNLRKSSESVIFRTRASFRGPYIVKRTVPGCVANRVHGGTKTMTRRTFEYFEYEPSEHSIDGRAVVSSLVVLLMFLVSMVTVA